MLRDGVYKSQFATGVSNGSLTAFPGGERDTWARALFGDAYHRPLADPTDRPAYGALNIFNHADGGSQIGPPVHPQRTSSGIRPHGAVGSLGPHLLNREEALRFPTPPTERRDGARLPFVHE